MLGQWLAVLGTRAVLLETFFRYAAGRAPAAPKQGIYGPLSKNDEF
jgi:hypothetical protein